MNSVRYSLAVLVAAFALVAAGAATAQTYPSRPVLLPSSNVVINPYHYSRMSFDLFTDLVPVALIADAPPVIAISASLPANAIAEFIALAKAKPGEFNYGSPGNATPNHPN